MAEEGLYIRIDDPIEFRRALLESSRDIIKSLQKYEESKSARVRKVKEIAKLRALIKELNILVNKLQSMLPEGHIKIISPQPKKKEHKAKAKKGQKESKEIVELERHLKDIEGKLVNLA